MTFTITALATETANALRADIAAGRRPAERHVLDEAGAPCRHCLQPGRAGEAMLLLSYQPFRGDSPYAVPSPIFLHAEPCPRYDATSVVPALVSAGGLRAVRSYDSGHAIVDGDVVAGTDVGPVIDRLLLDDRADYVHVHCATNGCFTFRADRG